jgi:hypothetical protein
MKIKNLLKIKKVNLQILNMKNNENNYLIYFENNNTSPYFNLALEEIILKDKNITENVLLL